MTKMAFCFSGQGAQKAGMFRDIYGNSAHAAKIFDFSSEIVGFDVGRVCFEDPDAVINQTIYTQPCVLACDIAAYEALKEKGITPDCVAGFSLGEYAALYAAGCLSLQDVMHIIKVRARAMQEAVPLGEGGMLAVMTGDFPQVEKICESIPDYVRLANYNSPKQVVAAGTSQGIAALEEKLTEAGIRSIKLQVSAPFHCELMKPAYDTLAREFETIEFKDPQVPVFMNYDGAMTTTAEEVKRKVLLQTMSPVRWIESVNNMKEYGVDRFVECGPGNTLSKFIKTTLGEANLFLTGDVEKINKTVDAIAV